MIDGATDSSVSENEAVYVRTVLNCKAENKLVEVIAIEHDHAEGIISATKSALSKVMMKCHQELLGFMQMGLM